MTSARALHASPAPCVPVKTPRYIATIDNVCETTLRCDVDADEWARELAPEGIVPFRNGGLGQVLISATALRWMGMRFREVVVALCTSNSEEGHSCDGMFLIEAVNSSRLFAWSERVLFHTPYRHGSIHFQTAPQQRIEVHGDDAPGCCLLQRAECERPSWTADLDYEGPVRLPGRREFYVQLAGLADCSAFLPGVDEFKLKSSARHPVFERLMASGCVPREWRIRQKARHARSKTFRVGD